MKKAWEDERVLAQKTFVREAYHEQFEQEKALITQRSKIRQRPANDLRREERYEVLGRIITKLFDLISDDPSAPTPLEIEYFNRYFDVDGMFIFTHPSWWKPRNRPSSWLEPYDVTAESEPAPMGSSLGWMIQDDADTRRNEFLNSPWVRVCLPIRPGREREALDWIAEHVEGEFGYPENEALKGLLMEVAKIQADQRALGVEGPEYVTVDSKVFTVASTPGAPTSPLTPESVYPIINEFDVTVPTDGFVYDILELRVP